MWNKITNPFNGNNVNINTKQGLKILKNYIKTLLGGSNLNDSFFYYYPKPGIELKIQFPVLEAKNNENSINENTTLIEYLNRYTQDGTCFKKLNTQDKFRILPPGDGELGSSFKADSILDIYINIYQSFKPKCRIRKTN